MRVVRLIVVLLLYSGLLVASNTGSNSAVIHKVNSLIKKEKFDEAKKVLVEAIAANPVDMELQEKMGRLCFSQDNGERESIPYFEKVAEYNRSKNIVNKSSLEVLYFLSQAYYLNGQYDEALEMLLQARSQVPGKNTALLEKLDGEIVQLRSGIELKKKPLAFKSTNLGSLVNSPYEEHSPIVSADETRLIFTSTRPKIKDGKVDTENLTESIWESIWTGNDWGEPKPLFSGINAGGNNATCSMSFDGSTLFFYRNESGKGNIFLSKLDANNEWGNPELLPKPINSTYNETSAAMSADGSILFFTSDRPGGYGGLDLWMVRKLPNGSWGKAMNLGKEINTAEDEEAPYFHPDGETLYYSSRGKTTCGGFDIFKTTLKEEGEWTTPENIGYPINTPDDDLFYQPTFDGQRVYYVSHKNTGEGGSDLYLLEFLDTDRRALSVVTCNVDPLPNDSVIKATLVVREATSGNLLGSYKCNPANGKFVVLVAAGKDYNFVFDYPGYSSITREVNVPKRTEYVATKKLITLDKVKFTLQKSK